MSKPSIKELRTSPAPAANSPAHSSPLHPRAVCVSSSSDPRLSVCFALLFGAPLPNTDRHLPNTTIRSNRTMCTDQTKSHTVELSTGTVMDLLPKFYSRKARTGIFWSPKQQDAPPHTSTILEAGPRLGSTHCQTGFSRRMDSTQFD